MDDNDSSDSYTNDTQLAICSMSISTLPVLTLISMVLMSIQLANVWGSISAWFKHEADIVVGGANSLSAAMGFAEESGLPNEMGLIKNQHATYLYSTDSRIAGSKGG